MVGNIGQEKTKVETLESNNNQFGKTVEKNNRNSYNLCFFKAALKKVTWWFMGNGIPFTIQLLCLYLNCTGKIRTIDFFFDFLLTGRLNTWQRKEGNLFKTLN